MRVLHVITSLAPRHGGPTVAALDMVRAQRELGMDVSILSSDDDVGGHLAVTTDEWISYDGLPVFFLPRLAAKQRQLIGFNYTPGIDRWLKRNLHTYDFIHVHTVFSHPANVAMAIARKRGVPYCVRPMGHLCRWSVKQSMWIKKLQLRLFTQRNLEHAKFIHCTSQMEAEESSQVVHKSPCIVLPHGIAMPPVVPNAARELRRVHSIQEGERMIVFLSRLHPKKGIELLFDALSEVSQPYRLMIAGSGDAAYVDTLRSRANELGIMSRIHWLGFVEGMDKWTLLQGADVFVLPSYSENFGISVLEAVACGLPVIVSDQVALKDEILKHGLGAVTPLDKNQLKHAVVDWIAMEHTVSDRARAIDIAKENFGWSTAAKKIIEAYSL